MPATLSSSYVPNSERVRWKSSAELESAIWHVFIPADPDASTLHSKFGFVEDEPLAHAVCVAAHTHNEIVDDAFKPQWRRITKTLDNLQAFLQYESGRLSLDQVVSQLSGMETGDTLGFLCRFDWTAVVFTKQDNCTLYQSFGEPRFRDHKVSCLAWGIEIPDKVFHNQYFQFELAEMLLYPGRWRMLLTSILRAVGRSIQIPHVIKRVCSHYKLDAQERSLLWLLVKVAIWTSLDQNSAGRICYKVFMLRFMCSLAMDAIGANLSGHLLHAISCKVLRRLGKLGSSAPSWLHDMVLKTSIALRETLEIRWREMQATQPPPSLWKPSQLDLDKDTQLPLLGSKEYVRCSLTNHAPNRQSLPFSPINLSRGTLSDFLSLNGSIFEEIYRVNPHMALYDVEQAVEQEIDDWVASVTDVDDGCFQIKVLMDQYLSSAQEIYRNIPDHMSIMLLTGIELWVALDKLVVGAVPMLAEYSPEVSISSLHDLLIRNTKKLHRLRSAYQYLSARHSHSIPGHSLFSEECAKTIFDIRRYVGSLDDVGRPDLLLHVVDSRDATSLQEPVTVYELRCSSSLHIWCFGTALLVNFLPSERGPLKSILFSPLQSLAKKLAPSSATGTYFISFRSKHHLGGPMLCVISTDESGVVYDRFYTATLRLYINETTCTSNDILAAQVKCPPNLSLREFVASWHLRSGGSLQWLNILRELRSRTLNFRRHDVYFLLARAASQVGPFDTNAAQWEWHQELDEISFCRTLLDELESLLTDVAVRSQDGVMMNAISMLLTRVLSTPCPEDVSQRAIGLLRCIRERTLHWVQELWYDLMKEPMNVERKEVLRDMAATCRSTFDVGPDVVHKLVDSAEDVGSLLFCATIIHANRPIDPTNMSEYSRLLLERDRRLSLVLESILGDVIEDDASNRGIDLAVSSVWSGYRPGPRVWQALPRPNSYWLTCETAANRSRRSQILHLNLLDGALLVDGKPIDALPYEIMKYPTYARIFGYQCFLVLPSDLPGMDFCTLAMIYEHQVHFALRDNDLVIQAQRKNTADTLEVIPHEKFRGDIPSRFVDGHAHWLNTSTAIIEIRPLGRLWEESSENWRIDCRSGQYRMYKGREWLVDIRSPTFGMVSSRLTCLDTSQNLIITTFPIDTPQSFQTRRLSVVLPRYSLSFFVNEDDELESCDFKNMVYDENQCIGTLFGLEHRLVLRPNTRIEEELVHRFIVVPGGQISREECGHHARITVDAISLATQNGSMVPVTYHTYRVDTDLGCLIDDGSWRSKLCLAHLHAQTSVDWMPDPLTGRTGVQEALRLFQSGGCRSIMELDIMRLNPIDVALKIRFGGLQLMGPTNYKLYPQLQFAIEEIEYRIVRKMFLCGSMHEPPKRPELNLLRVLRTAYLLPFEAIGPVKPMDIHPCEPSEPEDLAYAISLAVYHWLLRTGDWTESWDDIPLAGTRAWANPNLLPPMIAEADTFFWNERSQVEKFKSPSLSITDVEDLLQEATEARQRFRLLFVLPAIVYHMKRFENHESGFLSILVALAKRFSLKDPPLYDQCWPLEPDGCRPSQYALLRCFNHTRFPVRRGVIPAGGVDIDKLLEVWPFETPPADLYDARLFDVEKLNTELNPLLSRCYRNYKLREDLTRRLTELHSLSHPAQSRSLQLASDSPLQLRFRQVSTLTQFLRDRSPPTLSAPRRLEYYNPSRPSPDSYSTHVLNQLFSSLRMDGTKFHQQYITHLHTSARYARKVPCTPCAGLGGYSIEELRKYYVQCRDDYTTALMTLKRETGPLNDPLGQALHRTGQWPHIMPDTLLRCLASVSPIKICSGWKKCLVSLALLLVQFQRSRRLLRFAIDNLKEEFMTELNNEGFDGWSAEEHPDWLLIQVQGNFLIRGIQADVANYTISTRFGENAVIQVNMGEGKSSVILPICATTLADGNQLVRAIVPKSLTIQVFRLLVNRLGGLVNRPIYHFPFTRGSPHSSQAHCNILQEILSECMHEHGILVVQPEHVLSLKLMSVEQQLPKAMRYNNKASDEDLGDALLKLQRWTHSHVRDILDEGDDILHPRFQLIYTIGPQQPMEGYPDRWTVTQQVLRLVGKHAISLSQDLPDAVEYERNTSGSFPRIRILQVSDARQRLLSLIADDVMKGCVPNFRTSDINRDPRLHAAIRDFISNKDVSRWKASMAEEYGRRTGFWDALLLLRGLLACNVLLFALAERRWRVDYGLFPARTKLAVPYRAKDVPAPRAEFGHPDITIVLTCLSYYYGGLTEEQLRTSFQILQEQDDPTAEYATWLKDYEPGSVPDLIKDLGNVNMESSELWDKHVFPLFTRNQGAVDFYLSRVVFPEEAKEFPWKLSASSWDLAETRQRPITGFSGTNDGQYLLPTSITQCDPNHQRGSNARVLSYLLQPENSFYILISHPNGERRTTLELLNMVVEQDPNIRVILDVGAQILDFSNHQIAKSWLGLSSDSDGAVYFNKNDEPMVLTKDGVSRPLLSSPLSQQLERCVVYLDDAHTRGTDLKFPHGSRAAVTLGPKVTKDRLVQGCMRMRKLGHGHFVMFLAPLEVDRSIRAVAAKEDQNVPVTATDILHWAIHETWNDIQQQAPHWAQQGIHHNSRDDAWSRFCTDRLTTEELTNVWLQSELKSLADLYAPYQPTNGPNLSTVLDDHPEIQQRCEDLGILQFPEGQMEEEQEREVNREIEREREVQKRPPQATPLKHSLHPDVVAFVRTGVIPATYAGSTFHPVTKALEGSSATTNEGHICSPFVLATSDFCKTIDPTRCEGSMDAYLRPVQWVLSGKWDIHRVLILLSPFEADRLMPDIRASEHVHLHVYTPRITERMRPSDDLMFYSIPPVPDNWMPPWDLIDQLNLFAGQLYLRDYNSYLRLCYFLGIWDQDVPKKVVTAVRRNRITEYVQELENTFTDSPLALVLKLLVIRRSGLSFAQTHMGRILRGEKLTEKYFKIMVRPESGRNLVNRGAHVLASADLEEGGITSLSLSSLS